ncbi:MAG: Crp/Fnr family transcriptional regulator [Sphingomonadales bacterium]|jgi:CRP-like cAMP-binding protein
MTNNLDSQLLAHIPADSFFGTLNREELDNLLSYAHRKRLKRGEILLQQGDEGHAMVLVTRGTFKISSVSSSGKEVVLNYIGKGSVIGEISLFDEGVRTATVAAVEASEVLVFQRRDIMPFLSRHLDIAMRLVRLLCKRLRQTNALLESDRSLAMGPKLARGLLQLAEEHGEVKADGLSLKFVLSQTDLGNFVSLSRENVNRQLREWQRAQLIAIEAGRIRLLNLDALEDIAEGWD